MASKNSVNIPIKLVVYQLVMYQCTIAAAILVLLIQISCSSYTHRTLIRKLSVTSTKYLNNVIFSVQLTSIVNVTDIQIFIVYSSTQIKDVNLASKDVLYCQDDSRQTFLTVSSTNLTIGTGFHIRSADSTVVEFVCKNDYCKLTESRLSQEDMDGTFFEHLTVDSARHRRTADSQEIDNITDSMIAEASGATEFHVTLVVMIDSETVSLFCQKQYPGCCNKPITTSNLCEEIRQYYLNMINAIRQLYADIDNNQMKVLIYLVDLIVIPQVRGESYFDKYSDSTSDDKKVIDLYDAMKGATSLSRDHQKGRTEFAASLIFIGHDLKGKSGRSTIGGAYVAGVCHANKAALIEERFGYVTFFTIGHELGHILGSQHDGLFTDCGSTANMLMGWNFNRDNPALTYVLSCCSLSQMYNIMTKVRCLYKPPSRSDYINLSASNGKMLGELLTADQYCKLTEGEGYRSCPSRKYDPDHRGFCKGIVCNNARLNDLCELKKGVPALNGVKCLDDHHWCLYGECVEKAGNSTFSNQQQRDCDVTKVPVIKQQSEEDNRTWLEKYGGWLKLLTAIAGFSFFVSGMVAFAKQRAIYNLRTVTVSPKQKKYDLEKKKYSDQILSQGGYYAWNDYSKSLRMKKDIDVMYSSVRPNTKFPTQRLTI